MNERQERFENALGLLMSEISSKIKNAFHGVMIYSECHVEEKHIDMTFYPHGFFHYVRVIFNVLQYEQDSVGYFHYGVWIGSYQIKESCGPISGYLVGYAPTLDDAIKLCFAHECLNACPTAGYEKSDFVKEEDSDDDDEA